MKKAFAAVLIGLVVTSLSLAQEKTDAPKATSDVVTLKGYVVDQMCAKGMAKKGNPMMKAMGHTKECALEDACAASGFGIFSDGKWVKFDADGDKLAKASIEKSKREKGLYFEVSGKMDGEKLAVSSLKESVEEKKAETK